LKKIRISLAAMFAVVVMALVPINSAAAVGDWVVNMSNSNGKVILKNDSLPLVDLWPGQMSTQKPYVAYDVDYFWVPGGCDARNYDTGYVYPGDRWYGPLPGSAKLRLTVIC